MDKYYKYTSLKHIKDAIDYGVYASKLHLLNDPYEKDGIRYPEQFRVCCMTASPRKMLMWSYYGSHKGCCIQYSIEKEVEKESNTKKVNYTRVFQNKRFLNTSEIEEKLYTKGNEWKWEKEVRAVWSGKKDSDIWIHHEEEVYLKAKVISVCFGVFSELEKQEYLDALETIKAHNAEKDEKERIVVRKMILDTKKYQLIQDPQYDMERTLEDLKNGGN